MAEPSDEGLPVPLQFVGTDTVPLLYANSFIVQHEAAEFILTVGQYAPPMVMGSQADVLDQLRRVESVPVRILGRYAMTRERLVQLISVLQQNLARYDERQRESDDHAN